MAISVRLKTIAELVTPGYRAADIGTDHGYVPIYLLRQGISPFVIAADLSPGSLAKARENVSRAGLSAADESKAESGVIHRRGVESGAASGFAEEHGIMRECSAESGAAGGHGTEFGNASGFGIGLSAANECGTATRFKAEPGMAHGIVCRLSDGLSAFTPGEIDSIIIAGMGGILMDRILREGIEVVKAAKELILSPHRDVQLLRDFAAEYGFEIQEDILLTDKKKTYPILKIRIPHQATSC